MNGAIILRMQRAAALVLLGLAVLLAIGILASPLARAVRSELEQRRLLLKELVRYQSLVKAAPELRAVLDKVDAHPMWQRVYHDAGAGAAESALQKDWRALAEAQGVAVDTLQPLDPGLDPGSEKAFTRISLRVGFNTTIDHLGQLLAAMQAAPHFMKFENLYVTSPMSQGDSGNAPLVVRGDVLAYLLPEQAP